MLLWKSIPLSFEFVPTTLFSSSTENVVSALKYYWHMPTTTGSLYSVELNICIKISKLVDVWTLLMLNSVKVIIADFNDTMAEKYVFLVEKSEPCFDVTDVVEKWNASQSASCRVPFIPSSPAGCFVWIATANDRVQDDL
ncbi:BEACH domain-containing protein lvsF [Frankliniella fusca]|uniref:BEACH domain-containing protein lvsF n=1 Tax=Frankliniella fusca TaxID=407009 RepID=A0AAE1L4R7_9NEOP|nr:BEACH domain-containing protein lvsF [Frankliniella fusca]